MVYNPGENILMFINIFDTKVLVFIFLKNYKNMNKNLKNKILSAVIALSLFTAMWASWVLWGFWRAVYPIITDITWISPDANEFWYGYWYGNNGWWYGYWYGYWYGSYDQWYYVWNNVTVDETTYSNPDSTVSSNNDLASKLVVSNNWVNVTETVKVSITNLWSVTLPEWVRITWTWSLPTLQDNTNITAPSWTKRWAVKFWVSGVKLNFSSPIKIEIPVTTASSVTIWVRHFDGSSTSTLTTTPSACSETWLQTWGSSEVTTTVSSGVATVYTCSASEFIAYSPSSWGGWGWWWGWSSSTTVTTSTWTTNTNTWNVIVDEDEKDEETTQENNVDLVVDTNETTWEVTITKDDGSKVSLSDINSTFAKTYIARLASEWIINWYSDWTFKPENNASRAEYLKIVLGAMKIDYSSVDGSKVTFSDVDKNSWVAKVVVKASELGLIDTKNSKFRPNDSITRAESMKMLLNAASIETTTVSVSSFADVSTSSWESKYVETAKNMWIIDWQMIGSKLMFRPFSNITRAEVSKIVVKTMDLK